MLLPHRTLKEADGIASQLVNAIDALPSTALIDREAFLHIGIVAYRSGQTTEQVIDYAEQATRHATLQGENGWYVYDSGAGKGARQRQSGARCWNRYWRAAARGCIRNRR